MEDIQNNIETTNQEESIVKKELKIIRVCLRCTHKWFSRVANPAVCPKCKSYYWTVGYLRKNKREDL